MRSRLFKPRRKETPKSHRPKGGDPDLPATLFDPLLDKPKTAAKYKKEDLLQRQQRLRGRQNGQCHLFHHGESLLILSLSSSCVL